jgi:hypothetical protein
LFPIFDHIIPVLEIIRGHESIGVRAEDREEEVSGIVLTLNLVVFFFEGSEVLEGERTLSFLIISDNLPLRNLLVRSRRRWSRKT